ncbi:FecR domain-containing protein [Halomonas llamarensis]|uniref:FecR domain-containing protein n=1 Tax=Halomonas llamarensis TaxID=2945104 RepID=A0ABT0SS18_9GAMM|nr:FecR domain-containing protein [Halomonas llamarensis]MCL7930358.1 FecR domain-containing protein [Halomonas llamarensis]
MSLSGADHQEPGDDVLAQAAEWFVLLQEKPPSEHILIAWRHWLQQSEAHRQAWARVEIIDQQFRELPQEPAQLALSAAGRQRRQFVKGLMVLMTAPLLWSAGHRLSLPLQKWRADYRTSIGEVRKMVLADGSQLWLNTNSALNVTFSDEERRLTLLAGEVYLETAVDTQSPPRPLRVASSIGTIEPLGTCFSVRNMENRVGVQVTSGQVSVMPLQAPPHRLETGEATTFTMRKVAPVEPAQTSRTAWQHGMLVADNQRLDDFLDELSRHRRGVLSHDPAIADLRLVGAYPLRDTDRILSILESTLPIRVIRRTHLWVSVEAR